MGSAPSKLAARRPWAIMPGVAPPKTVNSRKYWAYSRPKVAAVMVAPSFERVKRPPRAQNKRQKSSVKEYEQGRVDNSGERAIGERRGGRMRRIAPGERPGGGDGEIARIVLGAGEVQRRLRDVDFEMILPGKPGAGRRRRGLGGWAHVFHTAWHTAFDTILDKRRGGCQ